MRGRLGSAFLACVFALCYTPLVRSACDSVTDNCAIEIGIPYPSTGAGDEGGFLTFDTGAKKYVQFSVSCAMLHFFCWRHCGFTDFLQLMPPLNTNLQLSVSLLFGSVEIFVKAGDQYVQPFGHVLFVIAHAIWHQCTDRN